jgi:putative thiamine transport system permease protein
MILSRFGPPVTIALLAGPILFGLAGTLLPAFGYLPALGGEEFSLAHFRELAAVPGIVRSSLISLAAGVITAAISLAIVMLFVGSWHGTPSFRAVGKALSPLLSVPHAAAAFGLAFLIQPSGFLARLVSPELTGWTSPPDALIIHDGLGLTMMVGLIIKEVPFLLLVTLAALPQVPLAPATRLGASLGHGRLSSFLHCVMPQLYRQIRLAVFAVIAFASSVVDVAIILGPTTPPPLSVRLVEWMSDPELSMRFLASAGSLLQLLVTAGAILIWLGAERLAGAGLTAIRDHGWRLRTVERPAALLVMAASATVILAVVGGLVVLVLWSLAGLWSFPDALPRQLGFQTWAKALPTATTPLVNTLMIAVSATLVATLLAILCLAREDETGRRTQVSRGLWLVYLPLIVPQAAFLFGLQLLMFGSGLKPGVVTLAFSHLIFVLPYVFLSLSDPWRSHDRRYDAVAAGLGKSRARTLWSIRIPMLLRAILAAMAVGFAVSIGQYLPTILIGAGRVATITTEAIGLASGGNRRFIGVYAFLQMLLPFAGFAIATLIPALLFRNRRALRV